MNQKALCSCVQNSVVEEAVPVRSQDRAGSSRTGVPVLVYVKRSILWASVPHPAEMYVVLRQRTVARPAIYVPFVPVRALHQERPSVWPDVVAASDLLLIRVVARPVAIPPCVPAGTWRSVLDRGPQIE